MNPRISPSGELIHKGVATLVAGKVTVTGVKLTAESRIFVTHNTFGGAVGELEVQAASRSVANGTFLISSTSATDTSTVDWAVL